MLRTGWLGPLQRPVRDGAYEILVWFGDVPFEAAAIDFAVWHDAAWQNDNEPNCALTPDMAWRGLTEEAKMSGAQVHLTIKELATRWSISPGALQTMRTKGNGPAYIKMSKKVVLYPLDEIEAFEQARKIRHTAAPAANGSRTRS